MRDYVLRFSGEWPSLARFLSLRSILAVESVTPDAYRRTVRRGWIEVVPEPRRAALRVRMSPSLEPQADTVLARVRHLFDLDCDPRKVAAVLGPLAAGNPGLRVPGVFDGFEVAVRAILGQQVTVAAARTLAGRFAAKFGRRVRTPFEGLDTVFPSPEDFAGRRPAEIAVLGVIGARARSILAVAKAMREGDLRLEPGGDPVEAMGRLRALPGIGEWTAQYVAMRALGWKDAWPHTDLGVMKALAAASDRRGSGPTAASDRRGSRPIAASDRRGSRPIIRDPKRALAAGEQWRPYRAYAVMHLWRSLETPAAPSAAGSLPRSPRRSARP